MKYFRFKCLHCGETIEQVNSYGHPTNDRGRPIKWRMCPKCKTRMKLEEKINLKDRRCKKLSFQEDEK